MEEKKVLKPYIPPSFNLSLIESEFGIAASSPANIRAGNTTLPDTPEANIWEDAGDIGGDTNDFGN